MLQSWIQTTHLTIDFAAAARAMRFEQSLSNGLVSDFDKPNYRPTLGGSVRQEEKEI